MNMKTNRALPLIIALVGCSSRVPLGDNGRADTGETDAPVTDSGPSNEGGGGVPPAKNLGTVSVSRSVSGGMPQLFVYGGFYVASDQRCPGETVGACQYFSCPKGLPVVPTMRDAGTVHITHGSDSIELTKARGYQPSPVPTFTFAEGDTFAFTSTGAEVPAFDATVVAPGDLTLTGLTCDGSTCSFDRAFDLTMTWTGSMHGEVWFSASAPNAAGGEDSVNCQAWSTAPSMIVPKALLSKLHGEGSITVRSSSEKTIETADWIVNVDVEGRSIAGSITF